jgi:putative transcriptional regulator
MTRFHVPEELLIAYAAGSLAEPQALLVATHVALCPACREAATGLDAVGGALLDRLQPAELAPEALETLLSKLDAAAPAPPPSPPLDSVLPAPLRAYVGRDFDSIRWKNAGGGVQEFPLPIPNVEGFSVLLFKVGSGRRIPTHTHEGEELTLVLAGGFSDESGHYLRGDVCAADPSVEHRPVADTDGDCVCLAVTAGKLRFSGPLGRILTYLRG